MKNYVIDFELAEKYSKSIKFYSDSQLKTISQIINAMTSCIILKRYVYMGEKPVIYSVMDYISDNKIEINHLKSRFHLGGGEIEVYTQHNIWQTGSSGMRQSLNTEIGISTNGVRTAFGAAPFFVCLEQTDKKGIVFHLLADYAWSINLRFTPTVGEFAEAVAEISFCVIFAYLYFRLFRCQVRNQVSVHFCVGYLCHNYRGCANHRFTGGYDSNSSFILEMSRNVRPKNLNLEYT